IEIEPRYARGYANLGFAYLQMARTEEAIAALEKAIELNPQIVQAWANLVSAYLQKGDVDKAIEIGEKLVAMAPNFGLGHNNLACAYYMKEDYAKAVEHVDLAVKYGFPVHPEFLKEIEPYRPVREDESSV
ncbi:tetratricopeptide repeat protein, partial [Thermodesulfitimonas autotrophica]|uniref:tetratricopeptide repeat protein n=1 Tax=Thermodesulfitimonas autotrophica TaxID=1894989 RepID=UPI002FE17289